MNWKSIEKDGYPMDSSKSYLVTDGEAISTSNINVFTNYTTQNSRFIAWTGDENTNEDNSCCSGERCFDLEPTHWICTSEIPLPK